MAAVLFDEQGVEYSDAAPDDKTMRQFTARKDNQIASLEILSIAFGISTFHERITGRNVVIHSDNTVAENSVRKGSARAFDHTCLVHSIWCVCM